MVIVVPIAAPLWRIASAVKKRNGIALFGTLLAVCCLVNARRPLPAIMTESALARAALKSWYTGHQQLSRSSSNNNNNNNNISNNSLNNFNSDAIVLSPVGLLATAVLLWKLSAGETRAQLSRTLDVIDHPRQRTHPADASFAALKVAAMAGGVTVRLASAVFVDEGRVDALAVSAAGVTSDAVAVPFARRPEEALRTINAWVAQQTNGQLRNSLPNGSVSAATALILVNALYFRASWLQAFTRLTAPLTFTDADGARQTGVPGMAVITSELRHLKTPDGTVVVSVPYGRNDNGTGDRLRAGFTAHFIVPPRGAFGYRRTMESLVARLDAATTARLLDAVARQGATTTRLMMPRLELRAVFDLSATFGALGVSSPLVLGGGGGQHVDRIQQTVALSVDESGTEGSAATYAFVNRIMPAHSVRIESPFVLMVRDDATQHVLFYGVVHRVPRG